MDWFKIELPLHPALSFEARWLIMYARKGAPRGLFIFRAIKSGETCTFFVPEATLWVFRDFFNGLDLQKCRQPSIGRLIPLGGTSEDVDEFYRLRE